MLSRTIGWSSGLALVAAIVSITVASAQDDRQVKKEVQAQPPIQTYRAKSVLGSKVIIEGNVAVGTVDDIVFADDGYLEYLIILNDNKLVTVPWEAAKFNFEKRTAVVNITPERFKVIPTYSIDQYPVFSTPKYRVETYKYYGLTPAERQAIRRGVLVP